MNAFTFSQKFGVYSLIISSTGILLSLMVPNYGVFLAGLSGIVAWMSAGSGVFIGIITVIVNLINLLIFCNISKIVLAVEAVSRTPDQNRVLVLWLIVFLIQITAIVLFLMFFVLKLLFGREKVVQQSNRNARSGQAGTAEYVGEVKYSSEGYRIIYAMIVFVLFCLTATVYLNPTLLPLSVFSNAYSSFTHIVPADIVTSNKTPPTVNKSTNTDVKSPPAFDDEAEIPDVIRSLKSRNDEQDSLITVTEEDVQRAVNQVIAEKIKEKESSPNSKFNNQYYIIELWTGSEIKTQNIKISEKDVVYRDSKGYEISIDRAEITSVKRYSY